MGENSKIAWTDATFNPWRGCARVSPGCQNCYADAQSKRNPATLGVWGPQGTRVMGVDSYWRLPIQWNREAEKLKTRRRVFCASLADVFEDWPGGMHDTRGRRLWLSEQEPYRWCSETPAFPDDLTRLEQENIGNGTYRPLTMNDARRTLFRLIDETTWLDWLVLTKRPENVLKFSPLHWIPDAYSGKFPDNLWIGTSCENQGAFDERCSWLVKIPAAVRFISFEPLLGEIDTRLCTLRNGATCDPFRVETGTYPKSGFVGRVNWAIVGAESGPRRRPCSLDWVHSLVNQCLAAGIAPFVKQLDLRGQCVSDLERFPGPLRIRQFPTVT
jgi:protein gp37